MLAKTLLALVLSTSGQGADAGALERRRFQWNVPDAVEEVDVPGAMRARGVPVTLRAVRSRMVMKPLLQHFVNAFQAAGLYVPPGNEQLQLLREPTLTAVDVERKRSYSVIFLTHGNDGTTVILGEADLQSPATTTTQLPVFPGSSRLSTTTWEAGESISYHAPADREEVHQFYREVLGKSGFQAGGPGVFRRGPEELRLQVSRQDTGGSQVLLMKQVRAEDPFAR